MMIFGFLSKVLEYLSRQRFGILSRISNKYERICSLPRFWPRPCCPPTPDFWLLKKIKQIKSPTLIWTPVWVVSVRLVLPALSCSMQGRDLSPNEKGKKRQMHKSGICLPSRLKDPIIRLASFYKVSFLMQACDVWIFNVNILEFSTYVKMLQESTYHRTVT